jgi:drug/metabolite transporter (DMT)-like permease
METVESKSPAQAGKAKAQSHSTRVVLAYLICASIWGTTWYSIRVCIEPGGYPSYPAAALRFTISAVILAAIWFAIRKSTKMPSKGEVGWITFAGTLSGLGYGLLYTAEEHITGGIAAVVSATAPLIAAVIAMVTRTEKPRTMTIVGSIVALGGVALVFHDSLQISQAQASAIAMLMIVCLLNASSNVAIKRYAHDTAALASNTIFFSAATALLWAGAVVSGKSTIPYPLPAAPTVALLYLSIFGTLVAFACFFYLLKNTRLSTAMTLAFVTPMIALVIDMFLEKHRTFTLESGAGIAVVLIGVALSIFSRIGDRGLSEKS